MTGKRKVDLAWAAGFIDGEGHINVQRTRQTLKRNGRTYERFELRVIVTNTHRGAIERLAEILGSGMMRTEQPGQYPYSRRTVPLYELWWSSRKAEKVLRAVEPYLVVKREQAQAALRFRALHRNHRGGPKLSEEVWTAMLKLANSVNSLRLHKHGPKPSQAPEAVDEADDGEGVTVVYEPRKGRDDLSLPATAS